MVSEVSGVLFDCKERVEKETILFLKVKKHKDKGKKETIMEWLLLDKQTVVSCEPESIPYPVYYPV